MPLLHNRQRHLPSVQEAVTKVRLEIIPAWRPSLATSSTSAGPRAVRQLFSCVMEEDSKDTTELAAQVWAASQNWQSAHWADS